MLGSAPSFGSPCPHVDMGRLQAIYSAHRATFWAAVASDYGMCMSPMALEHAWKTGICCSQHQAITPLSPAASPDHSDREGNAKVHDKTRISAILGLETQPRSPQDQHMVRRMEDERSMNVISAHA
ncbi:unnamed protein product [Parascedosporium putredinis]|uniref:Uncharacterized protein n=1 Tax=Parascedosporium putredinis TaxID=1442378 RepID=A0A9P1HB48_9PEZI|nr:unnamed protein product [Parascedosporium putredinis]CAI8002838.1 unnamed protein product [Parascedosporium putredinis]